MHDDRTAAQYGFRGGLVPGVTVYGYMAAALGPSFLERGGMKLRLIRPFYEGDEVIVTRPDEATVEARDATGQVCASGTLCEFTRPALADYPPAPIPDDRPAADRESLTPGRILGTITHTPPEPVPEALLELSNRVLMRNVVLKPWIHASSELQHFSLARSGEPLEVRARVRDVFEKKGHNFVVYEVVVLGSDGRLVQHVVHTAIYEPLSRDRADAGASSSA